MDLRDILNDRPAARSKVTNAGGTTSHNPPSRPGHIGQPVVQPQPQKAALQHASPTQQSHPSLTRQQSFPLMPHTQQEIYAAQHQQPHSSYAPHRDEYFRDHTLSVSPKTQPHSIPRNASYEPHTTYDPIASDARTIDGAYSTPNRIHNRQPSLQSLVSNHSTGFRDGMHAREAQTHSPHLMQTQSITSSPMQSRSAENRTPNFTHSPLDARPNSSFRPPTHSPLQHNRQSPVMMKTMAPPLTPSQSLQSPLSHPQDNHSAPTFPSPSVSKTQSRTASVVNIPAGSIPQPEYRHEHAALESRKSIPTPTESPHTLRETDFRQKPADTPSSRKRSLEAVEDMAPPSKRPRQSAPPIWAQRVQWKEPLQTMEEWIPHLRSLAPSGSEPGQKLQRVPSVAQTARLSVSDQRNGQDSDHGHTNGTSQGEGTREFDVSPVGKYELSLDGHVPFSDITREVARFLFANVVTAPELGIGSFEVEAKLGHLIDPRTSQRMQLPISTEAVLQEGHDYHFQSHMTTAQHKRMNEYLNTETRRTQQPGGHRAKIQYEHLRETDKFFEMPREFFESLPEPVKNIQNNHRHAPRIRTTTDQKSGQIKAAIYKLKVRNLEIYCPADDFDVRISVALEIKYPYPVDTLAEQQVKKGDTPARFKDRLSYKHQFVSVDLTQVTDGGQKKQELELEIETGLLRDEGLRAEAGLPNHYEGICGIFTNYIRVMNRTCRS